MRARIKGILSHCAAAVPILVGWLVVYLFEGIYRAGFMLLVASIIFAAMIETRLLLRCSREGGRIGAQWAKELLYTALLFLPVHFVSLLLADFLGEHFAYASMGDGLAYVLPFMLLVTAVLIFVYKLIVLVVAAVYHMRRQG